MSEAAKISGENEPSVLETVKKEEGIWASFAVTPQTARVSATV